MNSSNITSVGELGLLVRARLAAGEPEEDVVDWLVTEREWSRGPTVISKGAVAWVREVSRLPRPSIEHPNITKALEERFKDRPPACGTCGTVVGDRDSRLCNVCWEVENRLDQYLKSDGGREHVRRALLAAGTEAHPGVEELLKILLEHLDHTGTVASPADELVCFSLDVARLRQEILERDNLLAERIKLTLAHVKNDKAKGTEGVTSPVRKGRVNVLDLGRDGWIRNVSSEGWFDIQLDETGIGAAPSISCRRRSLYALDEVAQAKLDGVAP